MTKIDVHVLDSAGHETILPLPNDKALSELLPAVITLLNLTDDLDYRIFSPRFQRVLNLTGTLYSNGVQTNDTLRIVTVSTSMYLELEMLSEPNLGQRLSLPQQALIKIGRGSENDIVIRHHSISRFHGEFQWIDGLHIYRDLHSANGSFINNQVVSEPIPISPGSILALGDHIRLLYQDTPSGYDNPNDLASADSNTQTITKLNPMPNGFVFVSYPQEELAIVQRLVQQIRNENFHAFWPEEIPPDSNFEEAINDALGFSDALIAIVTPEAITNAGLMDQWHQYFLARKPMIAIQYHEHEMPPIFDEHIVINFEGDINRLHAKVIEKLKQLLR